MEPVLLGPFDDLWLRAPLCGGALLRMQFLLEAQALVQEVVDLVVRDARLERLRQVDESKEKRDQDPGQHEGHGAKAPAGADGDAGSAARGDRPRTGRKGDRTHA